MLIGIWVLEEMWVLVKKYLFYILIVYNFKFLLILWNRLLCYIFIRNIDCIKLDFGVIINLIFRFEIKNLNFCNKFLK